jgi:putative transposase
MFEFPAAIPKVIYSTNAIESVISMIRKFTRNCKLYPIRETSKKWTMPIENWQAA